MLNMDFSVFFYKNYYGKVSIKGNQNHSVSHFERTCKDGAHLLLHTGLPKNKPYDQEHCPDTP